MFIIFSKLFLFSILLHSNVFELHCLHHMGDPHMIPNHLRGLQRELLWLNVDYEHKNRRSRSSLPCDERDWLLQCCRKHMLNKQDHPLLIREMILSYESLEVETYEPTFFINNCIDWSKVDLRLRSRSAIWDFGIQVARVIGLLCKF